MGLHAIFCEVLEDDVGNFCVELSLTRQILFLDTVSGGGGILIADYAGACLFSLVNGLEFEEQWSKS